MNLQLFRYLPAILKGEYDPSVGMDGGVVDVAEPQAVGVCDRECVGRLYLHQKSLKSGAFTGAFGSEAFIFIILISQGGTVKNYAQKRLQNL